MTKGIEFFHGPDRDVLRPGEGGTLISDFGVPFHGIVPRGLRVWLDDGNGGPQRWRESVHRLSDPPEHDDADLAELRAEAGRRGVLSFSDSARAAAAYAAAASITEAAVWNVKEGQTSSVWIVEPNAGDQFVLNVARDDAAGDELRESSARMRALSKAAPELRVATVHDIAEVHVEVDGAERGVVVTRNEAIGGALEVHALPDGDGYALVDEFLTDEDAPARIRAIRGRRVSAAELAAIEAVVRGVERAAAAGERFAIDVNDGDIVWDGSEAVIVAVG